MRRTAVAIIFVVTIDPLDDRLIDDPDIGDVDLLEVARATVIPGPVDIVGPQRIPADRRTSDTDADTPATTADECHQRRRVAWPHELRPRQPAPGIIGPYPATVVERREAPRRIVHPGPAPGRDIRPVAVTVGRPARRHRSRPRGHSDRPARGQAGGRG